MSETPSLEINLDEISLQKTMQIRYQLNDEVVARYRDRMLAGDAFPPISVYKIHDDFFIADGCHRFFAAKEAKFKAIFCTIFEGTEKDRLWFALGANRAHGLQLSHEDLRRAIDLAVKTWPEKSQKEIAEHIGVSQSTVSRAQRRDNMQVHNTPFRYDILGRSRPKFYSKTDQDICASEIQNETYPPAEEKSKELPESEPELEPERESEPTEFEAQSDGMQKAHEAIRILETISKNDRNDALLFVRHWIDNFGLTRTA